MTFGVIDMDSLKMSSCSCSCYCVLSVIHKSCTYSDLHLKHIN